MVTTITGSPGVAAAPVAGEALLAWRAISATVPGASHLRARRPNQDALGIVPGRARVLSEPRVIAAVSDGHGSARYFRSSIGSNCAVSATLDVLAELMAEDGQPSFVKRIAEETLARTLVDAWEAQVRRHLRQSPFTPAELAEVERVYGPAARSRVEERPALAYGATLLAAAVTERYCLLAQLGDGDLLLVDGNGSVERAFPRDGRLVANETTSLCMPDAWREVRVRYQTLAGAPPALILLATDGYANSFSNDAGFHQVATDLWQMLRDEGADAVQQELPGWLRETSDNGSGDDITVALLLHQGAARPGR